MQKRTIGEKTFAVFNIMILCTIGLACIIPIWHCICASISQPTLLSAKRGLVLYPLGIPTLEGYKQCLKNTDLLRSYGNTLFYLVTGTAFGVVLTVLAGYGLSRKLMWSKSIAMFITFTMMLNGGIIPTYMVVRNLGMLNTRWAIILPTAVSVFNIMVTRTSFAAIPESLLEAARIDGAGHFRILWSIVLPVSKSILAVVTLFYAIQIWNSWFHTAIYVTERDLYPLQIVLREIVLQNTAANTDISELNEVNQIQVLIQYCVIMMSIVPMMVLYPFIQKYFVSGVMIGSIKG